MPCDCLLLGGSAVVSEAMLTGESVPQRKEGLVDADLTTMLDVDGAHRKHVLFGGTDLLDAVEVTAHDRHPRTAASRSVGAEDGLRDGPRFTHAHDPLRDGAGHWFDGNKKIHWRFTYFRGSSFFVRPPGGPEGPKKKPLQARAPLYLDNHVRRAARAADGVVFGRDQ